MKLMFGNTEEQHDFAQRNARFFDRFDNLKTALSMAFVREGESDFPIDRLVFYSGRVCAEDFNEILLLAANGYGFGATKLVRGMFERLVTAIFLHQKPEFADDYFDFYWVSQRKELQTALEVFGPQARHRLHGKGRWTWQVPYRWLLPATETGS
jgi:hypothetical protein